VTKSGTMGEGLGPVMSSSVVIPVKTSRVVRPPFFPNKISVFNLSPTIIVRLGSKSTLALTQSNIVPDGFPVQTGFRLNAYRSGALIDPAPGNKPAEVGKVLSSLVAMK